MDIVFSREFGTPSYEQNDDPRLLLRALIFRNGKSIIVVGFGTGTIIEAPRSLANNDIGAIKFQDPRLQVPIPQPLSRASSSTCCCGPGCVAADFPFHHPRPDVKCKCLHNWQRTADSGLD